MIPTMTTSLLGMLWPGGRFFRSYSVPDLRNPPNWTELAVARDCKVLDRKDSRSLTGWLKALLPVHRGWLMLIGIIDRYAYDALQPNKGLFVSEAEEIEMGDFSRRAIFGLSGILDHFLPSTRSDDLESGPETVDKLVFRMHAPEHMVKIPDALSDADIPIQTLIALFLSYLIGTDGQYYSLQMPDREVAQYYSRA
ncbi:hypothetical protein BDV59DRAFT_188440 [Aspergillus ambiguus]|uniref:uncharacterized protein n=1 Tax=Aspergillus ambiguus TaxID=176160 RepID=UPI003CCD0C4E